MKKSEMGPSPEEKKDPKDVFLGALNEELSIMEKAGRISPGEVEERKKAAAMIETGFSDDPKHDALIFSRVGIADEKELVEIFNKKNSKEGNLSPEGDSQEQMKEVEFERALKEDAESEFREVFAILESHLPSIKSKLSPKEQSVIEYYKMHNAWDEARERMNDEKEQLELTSLTAEERNIERIKKYLEDHKNELSEEGKFFLQATIELRKAAEKKQAMRVNS